MMLMTAQDMDHSDQQARDAARRGDLLDLSAALFAYCEQLRCRCADLEARIEALEARQGTEQG